MTKTPQFYRAEIGKLEKMFLQNKPEGQVWKRFQQDLLNHHKFEISFDSRFSDTFKEYFSFVVQTHSGSETLTVKLAWIELLNKIVRDHKFISKRDFKYIQDQIIGIKKSPSTSWLRQLAFIRGSSSISEFRGQFLHRLCNLNEVEAEQIAEQTENQEPQAIRRLKQEYSAFFEQYMLQNINLKVASLIESQWAKWQVKSEMLPANLIASIQKRLGVFQVGGTENEVTINRTLIDIANNNLYQNDREIQQRLQNQLELIEKALQKFSGLNIIKNKELSLHIGKFGSITSGFAGTDADLDLTILTNSYVKEEQFLKVLHEFLKKEYQEGDRRSHARKAIPDLIITAKIPLITITINQRGKKEMKVDIIVNNILGIINSKFLKVYSGIRWVKNLGILVKLWGKSVQLIDKNALSSYAVILMLIHYLIRAKYIKPIMDARNRTFDSPYFMYKRIKKNELQQFKVYYEFKNQSTDVTTVERVSYFQILQGFFKYYASDIWNEAEQTRIITVDQSTSKPTDIDATLTFKDPFDEPHNPGRLRSQSKDFLIIKFKEAYTQLLDAKENAKYTSNVISDRVTELFSGRH